MMATLRVLVFGSTGTGKTSICNALTGHERPVADSAVGVTFSSFVFPAIHFEGHYIEFTDTAGLNESDKGRVKPAAAVQQLVELIKHSADGFNLLIHVMQAHCDNYEFFVKELTQKTVPCILVVTGCENSDPMSAWADENKPEFEKQGFDYRDVVATCFASGGRFESVYAPLRDESRAAVLKGIVAHYTAAKRLYQDEQGFFQVLKRAWNWVCRWLGHPDLEIVVNTGIKKMLVRCHSPAIWLLHANQLPISACELAKDKLCSE